MYTFVFTNRLADESIIGELSYQVETMLGDTTESEMVFQYILFPSDVSADAFLATAENAEPTQLEELARQYGGEFLW